MGSELPVKPPVAGDAVFPRRYFVVVPRFLLSMLLYMDRACISTAKDAVTGELGLSKEQWSWVLASFAFGYALFQTPSGALADPAGRPRGAGGRGDALVCLHRLDGNGLELRHAAGRAVFLRCRGGRCISGHGARRLFMDSRQ